VSYGSTRLFDGLVASLCFNDDSRVLVVTTLLQGVSFFCRGFGLSVSHNLLDGSLGIYFDQLQALVDVETR
jgi:hypothetical protein